MSSAILLKEKPAGNPEIVNVSVMVGLVFAFTLGQIMLCVIAFDVALNECDAVSVAAAPVIMFPLLSVMLMPVLDASVPLLAKFNLILSAAKACIAAKRRNVTIVV